LAIGDWTGREEVVEESLQRAAYAPCLVKQLLSRTILLVLLSLFSFSANFVREGKTREAMLHGGQAIGYGRIGW